MRSLAPRRITACAPTPDPRGPHFAVLAETDLRAFVTSSGARQRNPDRDAYDGPILFVHMCHDDERRFDRAVATRTSTQNAAIPNGPRTIRPQAGKTHSVGQEDSTPKMLEIRTYAPPLARITDETINAQNQAIRDLGAKLFAYD
jgi:hypothetical protein